MEEQSVKLNGKELYKMIIELYGNKEDYVSNENGMINIKKPGKYNDYEIIVDHSIEGHEIMDMKKIREYFESINRTRISVICGLRTEGDPYGVYYCDYCNTSLFDNFNERSEYYKYCNECHMDMCQLCSEESDESGKLTENWEKRKDKIIMCRENHDMERRERYAMAGGFSCDICSETIKDDKRYSNYRKVDDCKDVCLKCYETEEGKNMVKEDDMELIKNCIAAMDSTEFGSMLDWIPIIKDKYDDGCNYVYINLNPGSKMYKRMVLSACDDHGREGFYVMRNKWKLEEVIEKIREFERDETWKQMEGWDKFYNTPIKQLMNQENMKTYYG